MKRLKTLALLALLAPSTAFAQPDYFQELDKTGVQVYGSADAPQGDLFAIIGTVIRTGLSIIGVLLVILIVYAGFLWMTAGGRTEQVEKAKNMLINAIIGLIIIVSSYALTTFVIDALL